jgi:ABC-type sugar transport system permease subunit
MFLFFLAFPVAFSVWLSFRQWNGFTPLDQAPFVGLANFAALGRDRVFQEAIVNTAMFAVCSTAVQIAVAFILAFTLWYYRLRFGAFLRALFFFPTVISMVFVGLTWQQLLTVGGPVDGLVRSFGSGRIAWLSAGWTMVLFLAGMMGQPRDLIEAAQIDGAGSFAIAAWIVIPIQRPVVALAVLLNVVGGFQVFDTIYVLTGGGPNHASEVLGTYTYWQAFSAYGPGQLGYASAISMVMVFVLFVFAYFRVRMSRLV